jgi:type IV secretion/conjugal transfer VirB4 family ATPase
MPPWVAAPGPFGPGQDVATRTHLFQELEGAPLAEVITWLVPLNDHVMLNKDGSMLAAIEMTGLDRDSTGVDQMNALREQLTYSLRRLGNESPVLGWHVRRRRTTLFPQGEFPDPVSQKINELMHADYLEQVQYVNQHVITFSLTPQGNTAKLLNQLAREQERGTGLKGILHALFGSAKAALGTQTFPYETAAEIDSDLERFEKALDAFCSGAQSLGLRVLSGDELGGFLRRCSSPVLGLDLRCPLPGAAIFADEVLPDGSVDNSYSDVLVFEHNGKRQYGQCFSLDLRLLEREVNMKILDDLMGADCEFTMTHTFVSLSQSRAKGEVRAIEAYHNARKYSWKQILAAAAGRGELDEADSRKTRKTWADEASGVKEEVEESKVVLGDYYGVVMAQADSLEALEHASNTCKDILNAAQLAPRLEGLHKFSSFCSTIPGSHAQVARWMKIEQENFIDFCPSRTVGDGSLVNEDLSEKLGTRCEALIAFSTSAKTPFFYTGYVGQLGHELLLGPSRTGKTVIGILEWTQFRKYPGARVLIFDKDYSCRPAVYLQGGHYIDFTPEKRTGHCLSPIAALMKGGDLTHIAFVVSWIEMLPHARGYKPDAKDREALERAVRATANAGKDDPSLLRLGSVVARLEKSTSLAQSLSMWVGDAAYARYFDNERDDFNVDSLVGVEMGSVLTDPELSGPLMAYAFYRVSATLRRLGGEDRPVPTMIYIPECWFFLANPIFSSRLEDWLATLAKLGARVVFDTQTPEKLTQSPAFPVFRDNVPNLILTPNDKAKTGSLRNFYVEEWGLTDEDLPHIAKGVRQRDYFIYQGGIKRRISFSLSKELLSYVRSDTLAQTTLQDYIDQGLPEGWQAQYVQRLHATRTEPQQSTNSRKDER